MLALRPTFSESWYRVASLKIRLRPSAQITRQFHRGERWYVIRDPAANQFMRLSDGAYQFIGLLDGKRSVAQAWELAGGQLDDAAPTQPEVIQILSQLHQANLVEADITPDAQVLLRRHKAMQRQQWKQRAMNVLFPRIPLPFDLNGIVTRYMGMASLLFSKGGMIAWFAVVIAGVAVLAPHWRELGEQSTSALAYQNWLWLWAVFVFTKVIHEFGHAFACRKFGGEVHEMGIMFLVFIPTPYVDASTAWGFPSRWQRMFVGAAGMYTELFFAALMGFVWVATSAHTPLNAIAYNAMLVASVSTVLFNANPLLRYDGYYMLSDFWEIPNLQQKSKDYGWGLIKRHVFRIKQTQPLPPVKQRVELFIYWVLSSIYRVFVGVMIILMVSGRVPVLGVLMALGGVVTWCVVPVVTLVRYLSVDPELHRKRTGAWAFSLAMAVLIFLLVGMIRLPVRVWAEAIIEPEQRDVLRAEYDGFVKEIRAADEQQMKAGQAIVVMENATLTSRIKQTQASLQAAKLSQRLAVTNDQKQRLIEEKKIEMFEHDLAVLKGREEQLTIRAKFDGVLIAPKLHQMAGQWLKQGQEFGILATTNRLEARAVVDQNDAHYVQKIGSNAATLKADQPDLITQIRLAGSIDNILHPVGPPLVVQASQRQLPHPSLGAPGGGEQQVDPKDQQNVKAISEPFEIVMKLDNSGGEFRPGQRAYVRFTPEDRSIVWQVWRKISSMTQKRDLHSQWTP